MATAKQKTAARRNVRKAAKSAARKKTISKLPKKTRTALGKKGAAAARCTPTQLSPPPPVVGILNRTAGADRMGGMHARWLLTDNPWPARFRWTDVTFDKEFGTA